MLVLGQLAHSQLAHSQLAHSQLAHSQLDHSKADGGLPVEPGASPGKYQEVLGRYLEEALVGVLRLAATLAAVSPTVTREVIGGRACRRVLQWALRLPTAMARGAAHDGAPDTARAEAERQCARLVGAVTGAALATRGAFTFTPTLLGGGWSRWLEDVRQALWATAPASEPAAVNTEPAVGVNTQQAQTMALWALSAHLDAITASLPPPPPSRAPPAPVHSATHSAAPPATTRAHCEAAALWVTKLRSVLMGAVLSAGPIAISGAVTGAMTGAVPSAPCPPLALLDALLRARREPSDALEAEVLAAALEAVAAFTRCFNALDAHAELSAVLGAPAAEDDDNAPSRAPMAAPPPPPRLRSALLYAMGILSDAPPASTLAARAQDGASPLERAAPAPFAPSTALPAPGTALALGTARRRLRAAALALLDALSERPAVLFAALPSDDRHHLLALLARRLEHSATAVRLSPSGRVRAADAHSAVGMLRRLTLSGGDQDGATYAWMMGALLAEVAPVTARSVGAHDDAPTTARMCASLLRLALIGAASAPQQRAHLDARKPDLHRVLVGIATRPVPWRRVGRGARQLARSDQQRPRWRGR